MKRKKYTKRKDYILMLHEIIDEFSSLKLTKKQLAEQMTERHGGDVYSHYWKIARLTDEELKFGKSEKQ